MHQAAVKLTNTGLPCARSSASRAGVNGSHAAPAGAPAAVAAGGLAAASGARAIATAALASANPVAARRQRGAAPPGGAVEPRARSR